MSWRTDEGHSISISNGIVSITIWFTAKNYRGITLPVYVLFFSIYIYYPVNAFSSDWSSMKKILFYLNQNMQMRFISVCSCHFFSSWWFECLFITSDYTNDAYDPIYNHIYPRKQSGIIKLKHKAVNTAVLITDYLTHISNDHLQYINPRPGAIKYERGNANERVDHCDIKQCLRGLHDQERVPKIPRSFTCRPHVKRGLHSTGCDSSHKAQVATECTKNVALGPGAVASGL